MTLTSAVLSFAVVAGLLTIIPGLDTALVLRSAVRHGRRQAFVTALGIGTGSLVWGAAAAVGVSALLTASVLAYTVLRVAGAAYMIFLGARMLWTALRGAGGDAEPTPRIALAASASVRLAWLRGLLTNLLNPKIGAFYVAVLPQFIPAGASHLAVGVLLATVHDVEGMLWFTMIIFGAQAVRGWLRRRSVHRAVDGVTGSVLVCFGLKLGLSAR
ncbi:LysE family translocator [Rugosimonospora acidiphila]|uniref:LysE family translocator n=1 Tax=Rugosimonospora acidiphila TaxID=556531 RepID=UPI0031E74FED